MPAAASLGRRARVPEDCSVASAPSGKIRPPGKVDFWRESNKPPFDSLQSFLGLHFASGIIARSAVSPDLTKNQPIGP
jgi:hypothetical protein